MGAAAVLSAATPSLAQTAGTPAPEQGASRVDNDAVQALQRMSAYLGTLQSFRVVADTTSDEVFDNGQTLTFGSRVTYEVRRPNGFTINIAADRHVRKIFYDGKSVTVWAPARGLYATAPAPSTIAETLDLAWSKLGIVIPLEDLFTWSSSSFRRDETLISAVRVGYAKVNGVETDQYAFQEGNIDWQIWIARGDKPVPVRVSIIDISDSAQPRYSANLTWTANARFGADAFAFRPPAGASQISFAEPSN